LSLAPFDPTQAGYIPAFARNPRYKWYVVGMLWFIAFFNYADRQALSAVFPLLSKEMHLTKAQLGQLTAAFAWTYGLLAPFAGAIVDRIRRKTAILGGLQMWSLICTATALSQKFWHLRLFMTIEGVGETFYYPASMSLLSDYHGKSTRSRAMGTHQTSVYIGTIAGSTFAALIGQHYGWRWAFLIFGVMGMLLGLMLFKFLVEPERGAADRAELPPGQVGKAYVKLGVRETLGLIWSTPTAVILMGAFLCSNFVAAVVLAWMPFLLYEKFHYPLAKAALFATIFIQLASMAGAPLGGWLADNLRRKYASGRMLVQATAVLCAAPFVFLVGSTSSEKLLIVGLIGWGLFKGFYDANIFASAYDVVRPEARGTTAGFMNCIGWLGGGGTAPIVIGYIADRYSLGFGISLASLVYVLACVLLVTGILFFVRKDSARMVAQLQ
jgi:MFS family permease